MGKSLKTFEMLQTAYWDDALSQTQLTSGGNILKMAILQLMILVQANCQPPKLMKLLQKSSHLLCHLTVHDIAKEVSISPTVCHEIPQNLSLMLGSQSYAPR